jgi:D-3-phosphoglycerate dehydrogenase / 2-oxoglutarate reductase
MFTAQSAWSTSHLRGKCTQQNGNHHHFKHEELFMGAWKVLLTDGLEANGQSILSEQGEVVDRTGISADELLQIIGEYDALIVRGRTKVTPAVLEAGCNLKVVGRAGVGVDNIDLAAARKHNVMVVNTPISTTISVAELTMALMTSLVREIPRADAAMKSGKWLKKELEGAELYQKSLGIVGFGRIGQAVAKRALAFEMKVVVVCDPFVNCDVVYAAGCHPASLDELIHDCDIISLHVPLTAQTRNMISTEQFAQMKDGVYVIDAARGGIVDEDALLQALESGKVAGAALDVFSTEPPGLTPLVSHPRVVATPHVGAQTVEAQFRAAQDIATEVLSALRGEDLRWRVA